MTKKEPSYASEDYSMASRSGSDVEMLAKYQREFILKKTVMNVLKFKTLECRLNYNLKRRVFNALAPSGDRDLDQPAANAQMRTRSTRNHVIADKFARARGGSRISMFTDPTEVDLELTKRSGANSTRQQVRNN